MNLKSKLGALALTAAAGAAVLTGCGNPAPAQTYAPLSAYGQNGNCYYVDNPAEVALLKAQGLCQQNWFPRQAPQSWLDEYYYYYDSPLYYDTYVPAQYRTSYVHAYGPKSTFYHDNLASITRLSKKATYRTTSGAKVTNVTSTAKFGSGSSFGKAGQKYGGGSLRVGSTPKASLPVARSANGRANVPGYSGYTPPAKNTKKNGGSLRSKPVKVGRH